jgi:hypothetical protein
MPIRDSNKGKKKEHYLEKQEIIQQDFGEVHSNLHGQVGGGSKQILV